MPARISAPWPRVSPATPATPPAADPNSLTVGRANQTISFGALADKTLGDPDFTVSATASSGLAVSFAASGSCTIAGNLVHLTGAGSCTITASQAGNANYNAAAERSADVRDHPDDQPAGRGAGAAERRQPARSAAPARRRRLVFPGERHDCGVPPAPPSLTPPSCYNLFGINGLGLLEAYRHNPSNPTLLANARAAGDALVAIFNAENPLAHTRPIMQDVEFLGALAQTSGDATYMTVATNWFAVLVAQYPSAASRVDAIFAIRDQQGFRTYGAWDAASLVRAARAVGNRRLRDRRREPDRRARARSRRERRDAARAGSTPAPRACRRTIPYGYDYTFLGEGSLLISIFDLPGFTAKRAEYRGLPAREPGSRRHVGRRRSADDRLHRQGSDRARRSVRDRRDRAGGSTSSRTTSRPTAAGRSTSSAPRPARSTPRSIRR